MTSTPTIEEESSNEETNAPTKRIKPDKPKRTRPTASTTTGDKIPLRKIHDMFQIFYERTDIQDELARTNKRKRATYLAAGFLEETGEIISLSWVYRILNESRKKLEDETVEANEAADLNKSL
jgi:hypothetical protein